MPFDVVHEVETCPSCEHRRLLAVVTYDEDWAKTERDGGIVRQRAESSDAILCSNPGCDEYDRHAAEFIRYLLHRRRLV
jgi:hypothetical protein